MNRLKHSIIEIILIIVLVFPFTLNCQNINRETFYVANWNLENLFDTDNDSLKNDEDFLPESPKRWTEDRFEDKLTNLTKVINYMNNGCGPDILTCEEVENINVMKKLIYKLRDRDYVVAHRDSPDARGIDVALLYDRNVFAIDSLAAIHVELPDHTPTRDILHVVLIHKISNQKIHVYVNHWPSRRGGETKSENRRLKAAEVLKASLDTLARTSPNSSVIILGDFNDEPNNKSITNVLGAKIFECDNKTWQNNSLLDLAARKFMNGEGSYLFSGKWDMIDQIIISSPLLDSKGIEYDCNSFEVIKPPFMIDPKSKKGGALPTYKGNRYIGGYSDHFPVGAKFYIKENQ